MEATGTEIGIPFLTTKRIIKLNMTINRLNDVSKIIHVIL